MEALRVAVWLSALSAALAGNCAIGPDGVPFGVGEKVFFELTAATKTSGFSSTNDFYLGICGTTCSAVFTDVNAGKCSDGSVPFRTGYKLSPLLDYAISGYYDQAQCNGLSLPATLVVERRSEHEAVVRLEGSSSDLVVLPLNATQNPDKKDMLQVYQLEKQYEQVNLKGRQNGDAIAIGEQVRIRMTTGEDVLFPELTIAIGNDDVRSVFALLGHDGRAVGYATYPMAPSAGPLPDYSEASGPTTIKILAEFVVVVERRSSDEMVVWLESNPSDDDKVSLPLDPDMDRLSIYSGTPVKTPIEFLSDIGPRVNNGQEMALREMVRFRFTPMDDSSFLHVGLCGAKCSVFNISGVGMSDTKLVHYDPIQGLVPGYSAYVSKGPTPSSGVSSLFRKYAGARGYPPGVQSHDFWVMRYTRDDFILWHNNNPVFTQSIFTTRDRTKLWVESNTGTVEFVEDLACGA